MSKWSYLFLKSFRSSMGTTSAIGALCLTLLACGGATTTPPDDTPTNLPPTAVIMSSSLQGTAPFIVNFDAGQSTDDDAIVSYEWSFGTGDVLDELTPEYIFSNSGVFNVVLTVTDSQGETDTAQVQVQVDAPITATAAGIYSVQCAFCHGAHGEGSVGPSLQNLFDRDELITDIGRMPTTSGPDCQGLVDCHAAIADYILENIVVTVDADGNPFSCDTSNTASSNVRRLSREQLRNVVTALLNDTLPSDEAANILDAADEYGLSQLPMDGHSSGFNDLDQRISAYHIEKYVDLASTIGNRVARSGRALSAWTGGACDFAEEVCRRALLDNVGPRILRRALTASDYDFYLPELSAENLITQLLMSPDFLYHTEIYGDEIEANRVSLTPMEIANRLAFLFWNSAPDQSLVDAANSGRLLSEYDSIVDDMVNDSRTEHAITEFYSQWMRVEDIPQLTEYDSSQRAFFTTDYGTTGNTALASEPNVNEFRENAANEIGHLGRYLTFITEGHFADLFTSTDSFAQGDVATAYGVPPWSGDFSSPVPLPVGERAGLLTRAAFHLHGNKDSRPVLKGARIIEDILCEHIPLPEDNSSPAGIVIGPDFTIREQIAEITEQDGTACATCHLQRINPFGFALEDYDGYGRYRDFEIIYEPWGAIRAHMPVNAQASVLLDNNFVAVNGGVELSQTIAQSPQAAACFARKVFRFGMNRIEDVNQDACTLSALYQSTRTRPLKDVFRELALQPEFRQRRVQ